MASQVASAPSTINAVEKALSQCTCFTQEEASTLISLILSKRKTSNGAPPPLQQQQPDVKQLEQSIAVNAITAHDTKQRNAGLSSVKERQSKRVGLACIEPFVIDSKNTLGARLLGFQGARVLWMWMRPPYVYVTWTMFLTSMILSCLAFIEVVDKQYSWTILCALPVWCSMFSTFNVELMKQILQSFDAMLILGYSTVGCFSLVISLEDSR